MRILSLVLTLAAVLVAGDAQAGGFRRNNVNVRVNVAAVSPATVVVRNQAAVQVNVNNGFHAVRNNVQVNVNSFGTRTFVRSGFCR